MADAQDAAWQTVTNVTESPPLTFEKSEEIEELVAALIKVQAELKPAPKTSDNPFYKSKYADLVTVWDTCRSLLTQNELAIIQIPATASRAGGVGLTTILAHASGQWIGGTVELYPVKTDPQAMGSAITYARRYSLQSIVGVVSDDDDDGNFASVKPDYPKAHKKDSAEYQANVARNKAAAAKPEPEKPSEEAKPSEPTIPKQRTVPEKCPKCEGSISLYFSTQEGKKGKAYVECSAAHEERHHLLETGFSAAAAAGQVSGHYREWA